MLRLAFATLRTRVTSFVGTLVAVALACAMVTGAGVMLESALRSHTPVTRLDGAAVVVAADSRLEHPAGSHQEIDGDPLHQRPRLPAALAQQLSTVPGVAAAVPDRTVHLATPDGNDVTVHGWDSAQLTPYQLTAGHRPLADNQITVTADLGLSVGADVTLTTPHGPRAFTVVGTVTTADDTAHPAAEARHGDADTHTAFTTPEVTADLSGTPDRADLVGLVLTPGADRDAVADAVRQHTDHLGPQFGDPTRPQPAPHVLTGDHRARAESPDAAVDREDTIELTGVFGAFAAFTAIFVVAGTLAFSVRQRTRDIGLLRAVGATPRQIRRMIAGEALLVSLAASLVGLPLGFGVARLLRAAFGNAGQLPPGFTLHHGWIPALVGAGASVVTTQVAALSAARRAAKVKPTEVFGGLTQRRVLVPLLRYGLGVAAVVGGLVVTRISTNLGGDDGANAAVGIVFAFMLAVALLGPPLARCASALVGRMLRTMGGAPSLLAHTGSAAAAGRVAAAAVPIALTSAFTMAVLFTGSTVVHQTDHDTSARTKPTAYVVTGGSGTAPEIAREVAALPEVTATASALATEVHDGPATDSVEQPARGVTPDVGRVLNLGHVTGDLTRLTGTDTVSLSQRRADALHKHVGDTVRVWLGDGTPTTLRVVALHGNAYGLGEYLLPYDLAAAHTTEPGAGELFVAGTPGPRLHQDLQRITGPSSRVLDHGAYLRHLHHDLEEDTWANTLLLGVIALFTAVGVVNTLVMSTGQRTREFALLRLVGGTARQVRSMLRGEVVIVLALGLGLGTAIAWTTLGAFAKGITGSFAPVMPAVPLLVVLGTATVTAYLATMLPARLAMRAHPAEVLGSTRQE